MKIDPNKVGQRIREAREQVGLKDYSSLATKIFQDSKKKGRTKINPETVRLWELGKHLPPWDKIDQLCAILGLEQEELLFGRRRESQLRNDHPRLVYVSLSEADLIVVYRHASLAAQKRIFDSAKSLAADDPAPTAEFHLIQKPVK